MSQLWDLVIDLPEGIGTVPVYADTSEEAWQMGRELFPGCRLALVLRGDEALPESPADRGCNP